MKGNTGCDCIRFSSQKTRSGSRESARANETAVFGTAQARMNSTYKVILKEVSVIGSSD